jgi:branched-subunit amino acid ABC-type transport system permease component
MNTLILIAICLIIGIALAHSWLGERYIVTRLLRRQDLPKLFGSDTFTKQTIRYAWHLTTIAWLGFASLLVFLTGFFQSISTTQGILFSIIITFIVSSILSLIFTRSRHLSWIIFLIIVVLCFLAALFQPTI